jgi:hypothetical protein
MAGLDPAIPTPPMQRANDAVLDSNYPTLAVGIYARNLQRLQNVNHQGRWYHSQGAAITALHAAGNSGG